MRCLISMLHSTIYFFVLYDINVVRQFCVLHCLYDFANKILSLFVVLINIKDINLCFVLHDIHFTRQFYVFFAKYLYCMAILCWRTKTFFLHVMTLWKEKIEMVSMHNDLLDLSFQKTTKIAPP